MKRILVLQYCAVLLFSIAGSLFFSEPQPVQASTAGFNPGRIIDDAVFTNNGAMSASEIQSFLNTRNSTCLKNYKTPAILGDGNYGSNVSAATAIKQASDIFKINPRVLLATLEKEQGIVTRDDCPEWRYRTAMGFGCPDTAPCNSQWFGLSRQLYQGARHFRGYYDQDSGWFIPFTPGTRYIQYNPLSSCGGKNVNIQNRATASLYSYTPYQPNPATRAAAPGQSVACGAYGNLNLWRYYTNWFGSTYSVSVHAIPRDSTTDKTGEPAEIQFRLSHKPTSNVSVTYKVSSPSNAEIVGSNVLTFTPSNWNEPSSHSLLIRGKDNPNLSGSFQYRIVPTRIASSDARYSGYHLSFLPSISLLQLDNNKPASVHRLANLSTGTYYYTASDNDRTTKVATGNWRDEGIKFNYCTAGEQLVEYMENSSGTNSNLLLYGSQERSKAVSAGYIFKGLAFPISKFGEVPVYELFNKSLGRTLYSTNSFEGTAHGYTNQGVAFYTCDNAENYTVIYRLAKSSSGKNIRLYTASPSERNSAMDSYGHTYEHTAFHMCSNGTVDVYRLVNVKTGDRLYTTSFTERDRAVAEYGYRYEGVAFASCANSTKDVYRLVNVKTGDRLYTTSFTERDRAVAEYGYRYEGVAFKAR